MKGKPESTLQRLDTEALFRLLGYFPHAGQRLVHASQARVRVLACGARWGKTRCAVMELLAAALAPGPATRTWIAGPRFEVVDLVLAELVRQLDGGLAHRVLEVDRRARRVCVRNLAGNEASIEGRCTQRPAALLGESLDFLLVAATVAIFRRGSSAGRLGASGGRLRPGLESRQIFLTSFAIRE